MIHIKKINENKMAENQKSKKPKGSLQRIKKLGVEVVSHLNKFTELCCYLR